VGDDDFAHLGVVAARVQARALRMASGPVGLAGRFSGGGQAGQRAFRRLQVVPVGPVQPRSHRQGPRLGQEAALDAAPKCLTRILPRSVGLGPVFSPAQRRFVQRAVEGHPVKIEPD